MFAFNSWYVACWARELGTKPLPKTILDCPLVLYRTKTGAVIALEDRCPHRHLPLHMGEIIDDRIRCRYHGMEIDSSGRCARVPSQEAIPPRARIRSFPAQERHGWIWTWLGDPTLADPLSIPDFGRLIEPGFAAVGDTNHVQANYQLLTDNLMDLSHVGFVHGTTIGTGDFAKGKLKVERTEAGVRVTRWVINCAPPPMYTKTGRLPVGVNIDRWQIIDFTPPSFVIIHVGGAQTGTGAPEGNLGHGINLWIMNAMTPETLGSTQYFWASVRNFGVDEKSIDELLFSQTQEAFAEDKQVLEAQQKVIARVGDSWANAVRADAGSIEARRAIERWTSAASSAAGTKATGTSAAASADASD